jgi:CRP-like cAMP-binding protein
MGAWNPGRFRRGIESGLKEENHAEGCAEDPGSWLPGSVRTGTGEPDRFRVFREVPRSGERRRLMYIQQKNLLAGMDRGFVKKLIGMTTKKHCDADELIFQEGHHASRFFVLVKGCVKLTFGTTGQVVFTLNHAGEAFGWSSLLGRNEYAATARCTEPTTLIQIDRLKFNQVLEEDPVHGLVLIRRLAELLGERLKMTYRMMAAQSPYEVGASYGSGQTMEMTPAA